MRRLLRWFPLLLPLAGCTNPVPHTPVAPRHTPPPPAPAAPPVQQRRDRPESPGSWAYKPDASGSVASYGLAGAPQFTLRCDRASRRITMVRTGGTAGTLGIATSYATMAWPAQPYAGGAAISLEARDAFLDKIAFSRGRFTVTMAGLPDLILPAWAEPARVIEDCRS